MEYSNAAKEAEKANLERKRKLIQKEEKKQAQKAASADAIRAAGKATRRQGKRI
jgi:hypothetical protein